MAIAVLGVVALYYVGVNALLASSWGPRLLNQKPELFQIHYSRAWTLVPLQLEVRDFQLTMQDQHVQISITADRAHGNLHLWTLPALRFMATHVEGEGVTMHLRPRRQKGEPPAEHPEELPIIPGFDPNEPPDDGKKMPILTLVFEDLTVHHLRELWIDRMRYTGDAEVSGTMLYEPFKRLRLDDARISDRNSKLASGDKREINLERLDARVSLEEIDMKNIEFASLKGLDADVELSAQADPNFLQSYLRHAEGLGTLRASGATGKLEVAVKIDHGVVQDGAKLSFKTPKAAVRLPLVEVSGAATVRGGADKGLLSLDVTVSSPVVRQRDGEQLAAAKSFSVNAHSDANLTEPPAVAAVLALSGGQMKHLKLLNQFIPEGAGVELQSGTGLLEGVLRIDAASPRASGRLELEGKNVTVKNRSATIEGRLLLHGEIRSFNLTSGAMDLSGSTLALEDATLRAGAKSWPSVWLRLNADPCLVKPDGKMPWSTTLSLGASNLQPLLAVVSANVPLPKILGLVSNSPNLRVEAKVQVREDGVDLPRVVLTSQSLRAEGAVALRAQDEDGKILKPWGGVVVHAGPLDLGVQFEGPKTTIILTDLHRWAASKNLPQSASPVR